VVVVGLGKLTFVRLLFCQGIAFTVFGSFALLLVAAAAASASTTSKCFFYLCAVTEIELEIACYASCPRCSLSF